MKRDAETVRALLGPPWQDLGGGAPPRPVEVVALVSAEQLFEAVRAWLEEGASPLPDVPWDRRPSMVRLAPDRPSVRALAVHSVIDELVVPALLTHRASRAFLLAATLGHRTTALRDALEALLEAADPAGEDLGPEAALEVALGDPMPDRAISNAEALVLRCELGVGEPDRERLLGIARAHAAASPSLLTLFVLAMLDDRDALTVARALRGARPTGIDATMLESNEWFPSTFELELDRGLGLLARRHPDDAALHRELASLALADAVTGDPEAQESPPCFRVVPGLDDERVAHAWARVARERAGGVAIVLGTRSVRGFRSLPSDTVAALEVEANEGTNWLGAIDALLAHGDSRAITILERHQETRWPASRWLAPFQGFTPRDSVPFGADATDLDAAHADPWSVDRRAPVWARLAAADALRGASASDARARALAIAFLEDGSPAVHEAAREALVARDRLELAAQWAEHADPRRRARAAWLLGSAPQCSGEVGPQSEIEAVLALDPARIVRHAVAAAGLERTHRAWLHHHERAVRWAAERGGRADLLAASPHALALRLAIGPAQARALMRYARDTELAPHARAWLEHLATWGSGADGWTRACGKVERVRGSITSTTGEELRVELVRWSRAALPAELRLAAADDGFEAGVAPLGQGTTEDTLERSSAVRRFVRSAYSGLFDLRLDDGRTWTIRAWLSDGFVAAEDHFAQPIPRARRNAPA